MPRLNQFGGTLEHSVGVSETSRRPELGADGMTIGSGSLRQVHSVLTGSLLPMAFASCALAALAQARPVATGLARIRPPVPTPLLPQRASI
jgi:hypothetical protein